MPLLVFKEGIGGVVLNMPGPPLPFRQVCVEIAAPYEEVGGRGSGSSNPRP